MRCFITEVGPRDGLQSVARVLPTGQKLDFVRRLVGAGVTSIDVAAFTRPLPQLSDSTEVVEALLRDPSMQHVALTGIVPNRKGLERVPVGLRSVSIWVHPSEAFSQRNLRTSVAKQLEECVQLAALIKAQNRLLRCYVSGVVCPVTREAVPVARIASLVAEFAALGADEVILADTVRCVRACVRVYIHVHVRVMFCW